MTEIQPSPPGYCGQDEAPGTTSCSPGSFKYTGHVHHAEQQSIGNYVRNSASPYSSQDDYLHKQSGGSTGGSSPSEQQNHCSNGSYRRKSESTGARRNALGENENAIVGLVETNNHSTDKKATFDGYNEGYRKNTPGYKNDSGYSESIGFDSFSLPLNERDDASPPPTPPVRDASSLKGVCYGPGHEKYPSWPSAPERHPDEELHENSTGHSGSHRSKSWTDHTNYPKEKPAQYTRPLAKRPNPAFTQQLKTVMERCEKIPVETFESRGSRGNAVEEEPRLWPRVDREGKPLGDAEYVLPSPPEREQQQPSQTISHAELEAYVRSYQDPRVSQVDIYGETGLTQAGLEEYTRVQHSQQASYAQSEGYHSYVSSVDSTTNTPFLDRLRRDSEAVTQRAAPSWEEASREGRDSVVTTSSGGSASSSETLKWHGSMSDVSVSSGLPVRQVPNDRWDRGSMSDVSSVNGLVAASMKKTDNNHENKWQSSMSDLSTSILLPSKHSRHSSSNSNITGTATITTTTPTTTTTTTITTSTNNTATNSSNINNNNKWKQEKNNKWQASMNDRNCKESSSSTGRTSLPTVINHCTSLSDVCQASLPHEGKWQESSIDEETPDRPKASSRNCEPSLRVDTERYNCVSTKANPQNLTLRGQLENSISSLQSPDEWDPLHGSLCDVSQSNQPMHSSKQLIAHSARVQTPQRHHSESVLYLDRERSQRKLYRLNSTQSQDTNLSSEYSSRRMSGSPISPQKQAHLSVAERISELEKQQQQQMRYTYLDPEKRHRVSDPTLKAIQKKALLSFYERHQSSWRSEPQLTEGSVPTAQSPPPQPPPRPRASSSRRASSASDYSSDTWRDKAGRALNAGDVPSPKHQHSNSCGSLSMDLLGPVIVGPAISIDDWVPERPPKKPHLRTVYNDRVPSPDLPPPSPPTVTENEVVNCDEPLPPPPPELSDSGSGSNSSGKETPGNANVEEKKRHRTSQQPERQSTRRSKHGKRSERVERSGRSSPISSPSKSNSSKQHHNDARHFVRATSIKHAESDFLMENGVSAGFATHRMVATGRSSLRYPSTQKMIVNERAVPVKRVSEERRLSSRPPARLPDLIAQRYSDSGNQRPAPQVPVESRIIRQESMRVESTRIDVSGLLRNDGTHRYESSSGQRPQPQVPKNSNGNEKNVYATSSSQQHSARPNYLALPPDATNKCSNYSENTSNHAYSVGSPVKTGYEASSKLLAEASPQKYHEPPKYVPGHHQRHGETGQRNYYALPPKYNDAVKQKQPQQCLTERHGAAISPASPPPPPLAPRQNTPGRKSLPPPPRPAPPQTLQGSQSKASYLAYRRERGAPDSEGSYKRTMSPTARLEDWQQQQQHSPGSREYDDPVLLRVTPHHPHELQQQEQQQQQQQLQQSPHHHHHHHHHHHSQNSHPDHHQQHNQQQLMDLPKSHSVDALHQRIEERNSVHSSQVMGKLSHELTKKLQATENRSRSESNNNNNIINNNDCDNVPRHANQDKRHEYKERLSPQSVQVLNDRNRQLERERRKLAASCEPVSQTRMLSDAEASNQGIEDFYRERSATIEMTSRNVELLNRRNALTEKTLNGTVSSSSSSNSSCINASSMKEHSSHETVSDSNCNLHIKENDEMRNIEDVEKPPAPISSPPRSPNSFVRSDESTACQQTLLGAISRRSGSSCSSSSSNEASPTLVSSSRKNNNCNETLMRNEPNQAFREYDGSETTIAKCHTTSRRKVSSPSQTENSWTRSNSPRARSSQTEGPNASIELGRISSPRSRSSSLSSASKISSTSCSLLGSPRYSPIENKNSPCVSPQPGIEGLTMVQRSEIVLRVNAATSDAASQTDIFYEDEGVDNKDSMDSQVVPEPRRKLQEEIECDELSRDLASQLEPNDKLVPILVPVPEHKKPTDYVSGLFRVEATLQPRPRRSTSLDASNSVASVETETEDDGKNETMHSTPTNPLSTSVPSSPLSATSAYFTTSEGKARFLTRYSRDVSEEDISSCSVNSPPLNAITSSNDSFHLRQKKEELVLRLEKKVVVLRAEQEAVREEGELNEALGARVAIRVYAVARPAEASKYRLHVEEVGKITSLLLGLSGRLARAENALYGMPANHPERKILESKRDKLMDQLSEAKILKSNIDKRSVNVSAILAKYLNDEEYADYQHFINMKAKLIMDGREIQDKVKLGEEQLAALKEAIN